MCVSVGCSWLVADGGVDVVEFGKTVFVERSEIMLEVLTSGVPALSETIERFGLYEPRSLEELLDGVFSHRKIVKKNFKIIAKFFYLLNQRK